MLSVIDERMKDRLGLGLLEYLYRTKAIGRALYGTLMNMVDMANYWGDVKTDHSEVARLSDASHAYSAYGTRCARWRAARSCWSVRTGRGNC